MAERQELIMGCENICAEMLTFVVSGIKASLVFRKWPH